MSKKLTTEEFIEKATKIHGDRYDYSLVKYINTITKIEIICSIHGKYDQTPAGHLTGKGCHLCGKYINTMQSEEFINRSNVVHKDKYDYSLVKYVNSKTKVTIICPEHGEFEQEPRMHLYAHGCSFCSGNNKITKKDFIKKAIKTHQNFYDYSLVEFINILDLVDIICPIHGKFSQIARTHLRNSGCSDCGGKKKLTLNQFVNKSNEIHKNKYDYSKVIYEKNDKKVIIICPIHGAFTQTPHSHLNNHGCKQCANEYATTTQEEFIKKASKIHNNVYSYVNTEYNGAKNKIKILCKKHGLFEQNASSHLEGRGCPICSTSLGETRIINFFINNSIVYRYQKKFKKCKNKRLLPFDFYVLDYNLLIEYDGEQHYNSSEYFGGEEKLKSTQKNDEIKNEYCKNNGISLLRIPYWEFKNIETILEKELKIIGIEN